MRVEPSPYALNNVKSEESASETECGAPDHAITASNATATESDRQEDLGKQFSRLHIICKICGGAV
ncbi:hypothetical protein SARC_17725, partial [Sphaeroforma arctica JP610]